MNITAVNSYTKKISFDLVKIRKVGIFLSNMETPLQWYNRQTDKPTFVCNCGLFTWNDATKKYEPVFSLKIDNQILIKDSLYRGLGIKGTQFQIGDINTLDCDDFVSGAPVLTYNGQNQVTQAWIDTLSTIAGYNPRIVFGWDGTKASILCIDGRQTGKPGATLAELPGICLANGLINSANFDGGYSAMCVANGQIINHGAQYRGVYTVFAIWEEQNMEEWKAPNFTNQTVAFLQTDRNGAILHKNSVYEYALGSAKQNGYAVWEVATQKMLWPVITVEKSKEVVFLESMRNLIDGRIEELNG
jgi:hypothetical protein